jgi:hypothetical protein
VLCKQGLRNIPVFPLDVGKSEDEEDCPILREYMEDLAESWRLFHEGGGKKTTAH